MTFTQIVAEVMDRLNLTSAAAQTRVGNDVNDRYRRVTSSIGLDTSRRTQVSATAALNNRTMTFTGIEKILIVIDKSELATGGQEIVLDQITMDEMHITPLQGNTIPGTTTPTGMPRHYSVTNMHPNSVDIYMDIIPSRGFQLFADGLRNVAVLGANDSPDFPESFHDILVWGAMADEYRKMEKPQLMQDAEINFERRVADLRMFIAKSAYLDIHQGRYNGRSFRWTRDAANLWDN